MIQDILVKSREKYDTGVWNRRLYSGRGRLGRSGNYKYTILDEKRTYDCHRGGRSETNTNRFVSLTFCENCSGVRKHFIYVPFFNFRHRHILGQYRLWTWTLMLWIWCCFLLTSTSDNWSVFLWSSELQNNLLSSIDSPFYALSAILSILPKLNIAFSD